MGRSAVGRERCSGRDVNARIEPSRASAVDFRNMIELDLADIMEVEQRAYPIPWTAGVFGDCLRARHHCRVGIQHSRIVTYGVLSMAAGEAHILNLCVDPQQHNQGIGRQTLAHLLGIAGRAANTVFLEVRPSNPAAVALYESQGFCEIGRRPGYYPSPQGREDAIVMAIFLA